MQIKRNFTFLFIFIVFTSSHPLFGKTRNEMITQHRKNLEIKLNSLEKKDRDTILKYFDQGIKSYANDNLADNNFIEQVSATIIAQRAKTKAELEARKHTKDENRIQQFAAHWHDMTFDALSNNSSLPNISDGFLAAAALREFGAPVVQQYHHSVPSSYPIQPLQQQSAPTMQQVSHALYYAKTENDRKRIEQAYKNEWQPILTTLFTANMSQRNQARLEGFFYQSVNDNTSIPVVPPYPHMNNAFLALFELELEMVRKRLALEIDARKLENAITATRASLSYEIKAFTGHSANRFQHILSTLEDTVVENADIACSICLENYKEDDRFGSVEKVTLQSPYSGTPCHSICKTCAKRQRFDKCPLCRNIIDQQDLNSKIHQPNHPTNWRPS